MGLLSKMFMTKDTEKKDPDTVFGKKKKKVGEKKRLMAAQAVGDFFGKVFS